MSQPEKYSVGDDGTALLVNGGGFAHAYDAKDAQEIVCRMNELDVCLNQRVEIEQIMLNAAGGVRPMPTPDQLRLWALALGTPKEIWSDEIKEAVKRP